MARAGLLSALAAAAALGAAIALERWDGLVPCALCLWERWPYRVAIGLGILALVLPARFGRWVLWLLLLVILSDVGLAAMHVGVERKAWPSPLPECMAPRLTGASIAERLAQLPALPSKACDDPVYVVEAIPISLAELNLIYASIFVAGLGTFLLWPRRTARVTRA